MQYYEAPSKYTVLSGFYLNKQVKIMQGNGLYKPQAFDQILSHAN